MEFEKDFNSTTLLSLSDKKEGIIILSMLFEKACETNKLEIAQFIYSLVKNKKELDDICDLTELFESSCIQGFLNMAQWLYSIHTMNNIMNPEKPYTYEYVFSMSVSSNRFSVAEWLLSIKPDINILSFDDYEDNDDSNILDYIFDTHENSNIFDQIKFLYSINSDVILKNENIKKIFINAIKKNKLDILNWSEEIKPNLLRTYKNSIGDKLFKFVCSKKYIEIVNHFTRKNPDRYHFIINEDGKITSNIDITFNITNTKEVQHIDTCSICYEEEPSTVTICNHQFCKNCIQQWLNVRPECPCCRKYMDVDNIFIIQK